MSMLSLHGGIVAHSIPTLCLLGDMPATQGDDKWSLESNNKMIRSYNTNDLRMTIVYR